MREFMITARMAKGFGVALIATLLLLTFAVMYQPTIRQAVTQVYVGPRENFSVCDDSAATVNEGDTLSIGRILHGHTAAGDTAFNYLQTLAVIDPAADSDSTYTVIWYKDDSEVQRIKLWNGGTIQDNLLCDSMAVIVGDTCLVQTWMRY